MKRFWTVAFLVIGFGFATGAGREKSPLIFSLPLQIIDLRPYVSAKVNGHPVSLMLDTGTNRMMIAPRLLERLHLKRQKKTVALIGDGGVKPGIPKTTIGSLEIGTIHLKNLPALLIPVTSSNEYDGIFSLNWLHGYVVTIDQARMLVTFTWHDAFVKPAKSVLLPFKLEEGLPLIQANVAGVSGWYFMDTGNYNAVSMISTSVKRFHLWEKFRPIVTIDSEEQFGGTVAYGISRLPYCKIGSFVLARPLAKLFTSKGGSVTFPDCKGVLGTEIWRRFIVTFDYANERIYLEPNEHFAEPFVYDRIGIDFRMKEDDYFVDKVYPGSPAAKAGIKPGERFLSISLPPASEEQTPDYEIVMKYPVGTRTKIRLSDLNGKERDVTLTLQDWF